MWIFDGMVRFASHLTIREVANLMSDRVFGGVQFVDTDEFDEVPGVRLARHVLGLSIRICGEAPQFMLMVDTFIPPCDPAVFPKLDYHNIDAYLMQLLLLVEEVQIVPS